MAIFFNLIKPIFATITPTIRAMKVLIVCNNAYMRGNGICTAVLSLTDEATDTNT